jgi:hypothetical protein
MQKDALSKEGIGLLERVYYCAKNVIFRLLAFWQFIERDKAWMRL